MYDVLGKIVPDVEWRPKCDKGRRPWVFAVEALEFEHAAHVSDGEVCLTAKSGASRKECKGAVAQKDEKGHGRETDRQT